MSTSFTPILRALLGALVLAALAAPTAADAVPTVTLTAPAGADAGTLTTQLRDDLAIAERRFGPACPGGIAATWNPFEVDYPGSPGARAWARSFVEQCRIDFNVGLWLDPAWRMAIYDPPWLCTLVVHEYGHLAGNGHSDDPADVMYPLVERVYAGCAAAAAPARPRAKRSRAKARRSRRRAHRCAGARCAKRPAARRTRRGRA
jgi:hypothetical protein